VPFFLYVKRLSSEGIIDLPKADSNCYMRIALCKDAKDSFSFFEDRVTTIDFVGFRTEAEVVDVGARLEGAVGEVARGGAFVQIDVYTEGRGVPPKLNIKIEFFSLLQQSP
jgi:hypothetical protein